MTVASGTTGNKPVFRFSVLRVGYEAGSPAEKYDFAGRYLRANVHLAGQLSRGDLLPPHLEAIERSPNRPN
jgi:hypothetical protein